MTWCWVSWVFFFTSYITDLEVKKSATWKYEHYRPKKVIGGPSQQKLTLCRQMTRKRDRRLLENNCCTSANHHRKNHGPLPITCQQRLTLEPRLPPSQGYKEVPHNPAPLPQRLLSVELPGEPGLLVPPGSNRMPFPLPAGMLSQRPRVESDFHHGSAVMGLLPAMVSVQATLSVVLALAARDISMEANWWVGTPNFHTQSNEEITMKGVKGDWVGNQDFTTTW